MIMRVMFAAALIATISGCGVLHSDTRETQVTSLRESYTKIPLKEQIEIPRQNRKKLLETQLALIDALAQIRADGAIAAAVVADSKFTVENRLDMVRNLMESPKLPPGSSLYQKIQDNTVVIETSESVLLKISFDYQRYGIAFPECTKLTSDKHKKLMQWAKDNPNEAGAAVVTGSQLQILGQCNAKIEAQAANEEISNVYLKELNDELTTRKKELADQKSASEAEAAEFERLVKTFEGKDSTSISTDAEKLKKQLEKLKKSQNAFTIELLSKKNLESIDDFLTAIAEYKPGESPPEGAAKAALAVLLFSELFKEIGSIDGGEKDVAWSPLVMQKKIEKARIDAANREIGIMKKRIAIIEEQINLRRLQLYRFAGIAKIRDTSLARIKNIPMQYALGIEPVPASSKSKQDDLPNTEERIEIHRVIAYYVDTGARIDAEAKKLQLKKIALDSEIVLSYSESSINQWAALIDTNVLTLETSYKLGTTAKQINDVVNSVLLLWIGKGVN